MHLFHLALEDDHEITFTGTQSPNGPDMVDGVSFPKPEMFQNSSLV